MYLTSHDGTFWAYGSHDMLAKSTDGAKTWYITSLGAEQASIDALIFIDPDRVYADDTWLRDWQSIDGGKFKPANDTLSRLWSKANWMLNSALMYGIKPVNGSVTYSESAGDRSNAWLDNRHAVFVDKNFILALTNRGRSMNFLLMHKSQRLYSVAVQGGQYFAYGIQQRPHERALPLFLSSRDGLFWTSVTSTNLPAFSSCTGANCALFISHEQGWLSFQGISPVTYHTMPAGARKSALFAFANDSACYFAQGLFCALGRPAPIPTLLSLKKVVPAAAAP